MAYAALMSDDPMKDLAEEILDLLAAAEETGIEPRHVIMALDDARRQWMIDNIEKLVKAPDVQ